MRTTEAIIVILLSVGYSSALCTSDYGGEPCTKYVPALPGRTPHCARPGSTYCEHPSHYPGHLIHYLIEKWRYDYSSLFNSEIPDDFNSYFIPEEAKFRPFKPFQGPPNSLQENAHHPEPIHIPKPPHPALQHTYIPPLETYRNFSDGFLGYPDRRPITQQGLPNPQQLFNYKLTFKGQDYFPPQNYYNDLNVFGENPLTHNNWRRQVREASRRQSLLRRRIRSLNKLTELKYASSNSTNYIRVKRQNAVTAQQLCQIRSQYIMPRAALNNKGNWMFVVNMPEVDSKLTQLVKSETCISQQCNGICGLPVGYTSKCEQRYVQKRLVALEGSGNQLYTDIFWFPSCCVCTISN